MQIRVKTKFDDLFFFFQNLRGSPGTFIIFDWLSRDLQNHFPRKTGNPIPQHSKLSRLYRLISIRFHYFFLFSRYLVVFGSPGTLHISFFLLVETVRNWRLKYKEYTILGVFWSPPPPQKKLVPNKWALELKLDLMLEDFATANSLEFLRNKETTLRHYNMKNWNYNR